jgi:hypothetical protein
MANIIEDDVVPRTVVKRVGRKLATPRGPEYTPKQLAVIRLAKQVGLDIDPIRTDNLEKLADFAHEAIVQDKANHPKPLSPFVSRDELIAAVAAAKREKEVCVPSRDYYARGGDWSTETIEFVDVEMFLYALNNPEGN